MWATKTQLFCLNFGHFKRTIPAPQLAKGLADTFVTTVLNSSFCKSSFPYSLTGVDLQNPPACKYSPDNLFLGEPQWRPLSKSLDDLWLQSVTALLRKYNISGFVRTETKLEVFSCMWQIPWFNLLHTLSKSHYVCKLPPYDTVAGQRLWLGLQWQEVNSWRSAFRFWPKNQVDFVCTLIILRLFKTSLNNLRPLIDYYSLLCI